MLENILDFLLPYTNQVIVNCINNNICVKNVTSKYMLENFNDARSATFYALGKSKVTMKPTILIVNERDLPNLYTGLTETYYQDIKIYIVVLSSIFKNNYIDFCCGKHILIKNNDDIALLKNNIMEFLSILSLPVLIEIPCNNTNVSDYEEVTKYNFFLENTEAIVSNSFKINYTNFYKNHSINDSDYGVLSKYLGYMWNNESKNFLVCTTKDISLDMNSLNCRYISKNARIIIFEVYDFQLNIEDWANDNGFYFMMIEDNNLNRIKEFFKKCNPGIIYIKERT